MFHDLCGILPLPKAEKLHTSCIFISVLQILVLQNNADNTWYLHLCWYDYKSLQSEENRALTLPWSWCPGWVYVQRQRVKVSLFEERMAPVDPSTAGSLPLGYTRPMLTPFSVTRISSDLDRNSFHKSGDQLALLLIVFKMENMRKCCQSSIQPVVGFLLWHRCSEVSNGNSFDVSAEVRFVWEMAWKWSNWEIGKGGLIPRAWVGIWDIPYHGLMVPGVFCFPQNAGTQVDGHEMWRPRLRGARHVELGIWCCELGSDFHQHI